MTQISAAMAGFGRVQPERLFEHASFLWFY